jgi:hypothetical protein
MFCIASFLGVEMNPGNETGRRLPASYERVLFRVVTTVTFPVRGGLTW